MTQTRLRLGIASAICGTAITIAACWYFSTWAFVLAPISGLAAGGAVAAALYLRRR